MQALQASTFFSRKFTSSTLAPFEAAPSRIFFSMASVLPFLWLPFIARTYIMGRRTEIDLKQALPLHFPENPS
jgi:hypothetical protein